MAQEIEQDAQAMSTRGRLGGSGRGTGYGCARQKLSFRPGSQHARGGSRLALALLGRRSRRRKQGRPPYPPPGGAVGHSPSLV